jgi:acetylglutamate kinase
VRVLVKLGGTLLESDDVKSSLTRQISAAASRTDLELVVVHGGGKRMTRYLSERGIESRFVNGLRVTDEAALDAVLKVFAGSVNHELVAAFQGAGARAVGLSGIDAGLTEAEPLSPELGAVGRVVRSRPELLHLLASNGYLPVVACVAGDARGNIYNVNADQMAAACAAAFGADHLLFLTDVEGVLDARKQRQPLLSVATCRQLIRDGVAAGGMQAKLESAISAIEQGAGDVRIAWGAEPGVIARLLEGGDGIGTRIVRESI